MKTLNELKQQHKKEILALSRQEKAKKLTGFACLGYSHYEGIGFQAFNEYIRKDGVKTLADVRKILSIYKIGKENYSLTFAGKEPQKTASPFVLKIQNYDHAPSASLSYKAEDGTGISIELSETLPIFEAYYEDGKHNGFGRYERIKRLRLKDNCGLDVCKYAGGSNYYHGTRKQFKEILSKA